MSIINNGLLLAAEAAAAPVTGISRSLRFNSADSAYLSRTPASAGNRKTWTWAAWVKRSEIQTTTVQLFSCWTANSNTNVSGIAFTSDKIYIHDWSTWRLTTAVYRDYSAWMHICVAWDSTQATANDRIKLYVNGSQVTAFDTLANPAQDADSGINRTERHTIGSYFGASNISFIGAYLADIHFIDGQALTPSDFTETDATTGQLIPKAYTGSYGTNGFHLTFSDNSGTSSTTLGKDAAGSNNWTPNNFSVAAGSGNDSLVDTPSSTGTDTGAGGEVRGNYCTWNPLYVDTSNNLPPTFANGNLDVSWRTSDWNVAMGTVKQSSGKWYWEITLSAGNRCMIGITKYNTFNSASAFYYSPDVYVYFSSNGAKWNNNTQTAYGASFVQGDVIGVALDLDAGTLVFYKNGVSQGTAFSSLSGNFAPVWGTDTTGNTHSANFGQRPFAYPAPSGFKALCTQNLPAPVVAKPSEVMDVLLWSGTGGNRSFSSLNMSPDFVWIKQRNQSYTVGHQLYDIVRGAGSLKQLDSSNTTAEGGGNTDQYGYLSSFDSTGFSVAAGSIDSDYVNKSGVTYVAWCWDAGSSTVTNTQGSITSTVRANASAGFSIVTYTGTLSGNGNATVGHGLGVAPQLVITKARSATSRWAVQMPTALSANHYLELNTTTAQASWGTQTRANPTSTVFDTIYAGGVNEIGVTYVAYCFAPVAGYSSAFSYTGNGASGYPNADGPYIHLGFRPRLILIKCSSAVENWVLYDTARSDYNYADDQLYPNLSNAEATGANREIDILSNGFKVRSNGGIVNTNAATYVGFAWAESPFQYSRAR